MRGQKSLLARLDKLKDAVAYEIPRVIANNVSDQTTRAMAGFASAEYDGINDVTVSMETGDNVWRIVASGEAVLFIEYGSGIVYPHTSEFGNASAYPPASWSASHGKWLVDPKVSIYGGKWPVTGWKGYWTKGNKSANVMYESKTALRTNLPTRLRMAIGKALT